MIICLETQTRNKIYFSQKYNFRIAKIINLIYLVIHLIVFLLHITSSCLRSFYFFLGLTSILQ